MQNSLPSFSAQSPMCPHRSFCVKYLIALRFQSLTPNTAIPPFGFDKTKSGRKHCRASKTAPVGPSCRLVSPRGCPLAGEIGGAPSQTAGPIQVIRPIIQGRFRNLDEGGRLALQALLAAEGLYAGTVDGIYGSATEDAVVAYMQRMVDHGEAVDGNSTTFIRELMSRLAEEGRPLLATAAQSGAASMILNASWFCRGETYVFTQNTYRDQPV